MHRAAQTFFIAMVSLLAALGLTMLYSTTYDTHGERLLLMQLLWLTTGIGGAFFINLFDYRQIGFYANLALGGLGLILAYLALANLLYYQGFSDNLSDFARSLPFVSGLHVGSARWIGIGRLRMQPSEFAAIGIILYLARYFSSHTRHLHTFYRGFVKPMTVAGGVVVLILFGGDLSTTVITGGMILVMCFIAGVRLRFLFLLTAVGAALLLLALHRSPGRLDRMLYYQNPEQYQSHETYQLWHSQLALGSGGWSGLGFTESRIKRHYLPEAHTDFIVAIIGEELGFLGLATVLLIYSGLILGILWIGAMAADRQGILICAGVALALGLRAFVNIGVVSGFLPTTGVTAPLISYGGSSAVATLLGIGLVINVGRIAAREKSATHKGKKPIISPPSRDISHRDLFDPEMDEENG